ncbi:hypothetical protein B0H19DRAFT_1296083 [Mycena capillaripes]|nr:hypothetical protein B0H19DRAFT_1296083 [Mycena capillaripes]
MQLSQQEWDDIEFFLAGMLLNNKDNKKGQQDSHGVDFCAHKHIGFALRFLDTSNTRYQCFSKAPAEVTVNLIVYRQLMHFIRDRKMSFAFNHLEKNIWTAMNNLLTIIELIIMLSYGQSFIHPVMRVARSQSRTGGLHNLWDMGPAFDQLNKKKIAKRTNSVMPCACNGPQAQLLPVAMKHLIPYIGYKNQDSGGCS